MKWGNRKKKRNRKRIWILAVLVLLCCLDGMTTRDLFAIHAAAAEDTTGAADTGGHLSGESMDIQMSRLQVKGSRAGAWVTVSFDVSGAENTAEQYQVSQIEKVWIDTDADGFPFASGDDTYKVVSESGRSLSCSWKMKAKEGLTTDYYKVRFVVLYRRTATGGSTKKYDSLYRIEKSVDVRIQGEVSKEERKVTAENDDITLKMKNVPQGRYSGSCPVEFQVRSSKYHIKSVVPSVDAKFPFQSTSEAYKVIRGQGKSLDCQYHFRVKDDVKTGYEWIHFDVYYEKDGQQVKLTKDIGVQLTGKKEKKAGEKKGGTKVSVPRLMVTGRKFDRKKIYPGDQFEVTLQIRNTSDHTLRNIKYTISSGKGEFVPADGINSTFLSSISAHGTSEITFFLEASADLNAKPYQLCAFAEYEDDRVNRYEATDYVSIPVTVQDKVSITNIRKPEKLTAGTDGDLTLSVNNVGENTIRNVTVQMEGEEFRCQKAFVGKLAGGASGHADIYVKGIQRTLEGSGKNARITVSYISSSGEKQTYEKDIRLVVKEEIPENLTALSRETDGEEGNTLPKQVIALLIAAFCIAGFGVYFRHRKKS